MNRIPITVFIVERPYGHPSGNWYVTLDQADGTTWSHMELGMAIQLAVIDLFQKQALKVMGQ